MGSGSGGWVGLSPSHLLGVNFTYYCLSKHTFKELVLLVYYCLLTFAHNCHRIILSLVVVLLN